MVIMKNQIDDELVDQYVSVFWIKKPGEEPRKVSVGVRKYVKKIPLFVRLAKEETIKIPLHIPRMKEQSQKS